MILYFSTIREQTNVNKPTQNTITIIQKEQMKIELFLVGTNDKKTII